MLGDAGTALPHHCRERKGRRPRLALAVSEHLRPRIPRTHRMVGLRQGFARAEFLPQRCFLLRPVPHPRG